MREKIIESVHVYKDNKCTLDFKKKDLNSRSKTRQEFADSANINKIISRFNRTGILSSGEIKNNRQPMYGDYEGIDYTETCNKIARVEQDFMEQEPEERAKWNNNPQEWLAGLELKEAIETEKRIVAEMAAEATENNNTTNNTENIEETAGGQTEPLKEPTV